ncbi:MAG TPA: glycosyltransferase family 39 protein, partial [Thermomicrobiales bacterium]|nr:glycosyltransferase family 39 protein [Thermomicrobiales bacterium]
MSEPASTLERERIDVSGELGPAATTRATALWAWLRPRWAIVAVLVAFFATTLVVPALTPVATTDDWAYARSAEILLQDHVLRIFPVVAATAVFPVVWGALFGAVFGPSFGVFRLSTVVITAIGGWALYGLCRELGVSRGRGTLGAAASLFNPLAFVLAFTFMTDSFFTAVLIVATYCTVRGLGAERDDGRWLVAGSGAAALALLTRQQGALIPLAIAIFLLVTGRLRPNRVGLATLLQIGALPVAAGVGYLLWLRFVNDVPSVQQSFLREAAAEGWAGTWWLLRRLTYAALAYIGLFALPIAVAALPAGRRLLARMTGRGRLVFALWEGVLLLGVGAAWTAGRRMPYLSQFFGSGGLGPSDVLGSRPHFFDLNALGWLTVVCVGASLLLA